MFNIKNHFCKVIWFETPVIRHAEGIHKIYTYLKNLHVSIKTRHQLVTNLSTNDIETKYCAHTLPWK